MEGGDKAATKNTEGRKDDGERWGKKPGQKWKEKKRWGEFEDERDKLKQREHEIERRER